MKALQKIFPLSIVILLLLSMSADAQNPNHINALTSKKIDSLMQTPKIAAPLPKAIGPFMKIWAFDHPGFGAYIVSLNDVNGDGFDDFAVSTSSDTTFIFFGGPNMDDKPDAFVLGGGGGLIAGDFNGDGYTDLITSQYGIDLDGRGSVWIYLHNKTPTIYNSKPDLEIVGRNKISGLGYGYGSTQGGDLNGDGKLDLVLWSQDLNGVTSISRGVLWIYLGSATPDTIPDRQIIEWDSGKVRHYFAEQHFKVIDINGDGFDDVICQSSIDKGQYYFYYGIYLGNADAQYKSTPDKLMDNIIDQSTYMYFVDMNGDGCPELFYDCYKCRNIYPPFVWGKCGQEFFTNQDFKTNASFTNEDTTILKFAEGITPIGHFTGTAYNDYVVIWAVYFDQQFLGITCYLYQGGPGWRPNVIADYGVPDGEHVDGTPIPIGDVTGDGIDDFALIAGFYNETFKRYWSPVWIFKGDKSLIKTSVDETFSKPDDFHVKIFPNPVFVGIENKVSVQGESSETGEVILTLIDVLGRDVRREKRELYQQGAFQFQLDVTNVSTGVYFVIVQSQTMRTVKSVAVINN